MEFTVDIDRHVEQKLGRMIDYKLPQLKAVMKLAGDYVNREAKINVSGRILQRRTGNLFRSLRAKVGSKSEGYQVDIGSYGVVYARIHDLGGDAGRGHSVHIPKRGWLRRAFVSRKEEIRGLTKKFIQDLLK